MHRVQVAGSLLLLAALTTAAAPRPQEWAPPSRQMPSMPSSAELAGGWRGSLGGWFNGLGVSVAAVRADGEGGAHTRFVRFSVEMRPVETWSDRNGDGRADLVEVFRDGGMVARLVDADYDGTANSLRRYDASGALAREERY
jgi:hypothetical protein